jgi:hypothetical protein
MTKEEFKERYCKRSGITKRFFDKRFVVLKCVCDYSECPGWAVVNNDKESIKRHKNLYGLSA